MSIGSHILRALFLVLGLAAAIGTLAMLMSETQTRSTDKNSSQPDYCGSVFSPDVAGSSGGECEQARTARATGAVAVAGLSVGLFVGAAAVSVGGRHRLTVRSEGYGVPVAAGSPGYPPPPGR